MDAGQLVPDEVTIGMAKDRHGPAGRRGRLPARRLPAQHRARPRRWTPPGGARPSQLDAVLDLEVPEDEVVKRIAGRRTCRNDSSHVFHVEYKPPKTEGVCDVCGGELYQRDDDTRGDRPQAARGLPRETEPIIDYYKAQGLVVTISALGKVTRSPSGRWTRLRSSKRCRDGLTRRGVRHVRQAGARCPRTPRRAAHDVAVLWSRELEHAPYSSDDSGRTAERRRPHGGDQDPEQIAKMREAGLVVAAIHEACGRPRYRARPPRTWTRSPPRCIADHGAKSNFLGYGGFPGTSAPR